MKSVAIIGGGPCGIFAALTVRKEHPEYHITIYDEAGELAKRIKISGNGRCNFSHRDIRCDAYYHGNEIAEILTKYARKEDFPSGNRR